MIGERGPTPGSEARLGTVPLFCNIVYAGALVWAAVQQGLPEAATDFPDVYAHAVAYGGQAGLLYWLLARVLAPAAVAACAIIGASAFGTITEALQLARPGRSSELRDLVANGVGAGCVVLAIQVARFIREARRRS